MVGPLEPSDRRSAERLLAAAFRDNPLNEAVIGAGPGRRLRANAHGMRALFAAALGHADLRVVRPSIGLGPAGVLLAVPPYEFPLPPPPLGDRIRSWLGQGWRVSRRWAYVYDALTRVHPLEPHWYLGVLGVDPVFQRRGLGSRLLRHWVRGVDADVLPAYLETDRPENVAFYGGSGFEVCREVDVLGVRVWCMWRAARARAGED